MFSIFQRDVVRDVQCQMADSYRTTDLDGMDEESSGVFAQDSDAYTQYPLSTQYDRQYEDHLNASSTPKANGPGQFDGSNERISHSRKRRKLTPSRSTHKDEPTQHQKNGQLPFGSVTHSSQDTAQINAISKRVRIPMKDGANKPVTKVRQHVLTSQPAASRALPTQEQAQRTTNIDCGPTSDAERKIFRTLEFGETHCSNTGKEAPKSISSDQNADLQILESGPLKKGPSGRNMKMRNGRFVHSFDLVLHYGANEMTKNHIGDRISQIMSQVSQMEQPTKAKTHPFFLGKPRPVIGCHQSNAAIDVRSKTDSEHENEPIGIPKEPVAWSDIKFSGTKNTMFKTIEAVHPIWPPREDQALGRQIAGFTNDYGTTHTSNLAKRKTKFFDVNETENMLSRFSKSLKLTAKPAKLSIPNRRLLSGRDIYAMYAPQISYLSPTAVLSKLSSQITSGLSSFDRGEASGQQSWASRYAPAKFQEVLQPECQVLRDWLQSLAVHHVKSGIEGAEPRAKSKPLRKKRRSKKASSELDDFIVDDEDDAMESSKAVKNAILIHGPTGCGKTASVYAVAKELGFEVFEIHPGMKRSAKDIFEKVGDMTQNHLVQRGDETSRSSSVAPAETNTPSAMLVERKQPSMATFLGSKKAPTDDKSQPSNTCGPKKEQKQSLILFEEVDILFDSDKSFWTGVQNLIQHSRRPVVMTCNDLSQVPIDDLELHAILEYSAPQLRTAVEYLIMLAAAEGHLLDSAAMETLYITKRHDLRACIHELNFWCQMTVGSTQGGLDWMFRSNATETRYNEKNEKLRICSEGTFQTGLNLVPNDELDNEQLLRYGQNSLDLPITALLENILSKRCSSSTASASVLGLLDACVDTSDARSVLDLVDDEVVPIIASMLYDNTSAWNITDPRKELSSARIRELDEQVFSLRDMATVFDPITVEKPTFPPSQGRLAPSIDSAGSILATDVAPYVRTIVFFDKHSEQQRAEVFGSQGKKTRTTRAALAAAEGGDKAHTRAEAWFPKGLNAERVFQTAGKWPMWSAEHA